MLRQMLLATTALVLYASAACAGQTPSAPGDANSRFLSYYMPRGSTLLYQQSASSGFSTYAVSATNFTSSSGGCCWGSMAADDFIIPGTGTHRITAVYAPGVNVNGQDPASMSVTFYDKLKYYEKRGITSAVVKARCPNAPFSDVTGDGSMLVDVSSCHLGRFKAGHDYAVAVQAQAPENYAYTPWAWRTNRNQINGQAFYFTYYESGPCTNQFTPIKSCFPASGYGPDLAFAIYGN